MSKISVFVIMLSMAFWGYAQPSGIQICLNSLGFLPQSEKKATVLANESFEFQLIDVKTNRVVFSGKTSSALWQEDVDASACIADFSAFETPGTYRLEIPGRARSVDFRIGPDVYNAAFYTTMRAFYLWRCGTAVSGEHNGVKYEHAACHLNDGYEDYIGNPGSRRDGTKGWHDAGDYGKYTVNAGITVGMMFLAWELFQDNLKTVKLDLPETAPGYPDYLKELKWETDWLLTMQYPDGSGRVSHKLTRTKFAPFIPAETDSAKRYFTDWSSAATADFVAMMAQAARYFKPYDPVYAGVCLQAAWNSYRFLKENPENKGFVQGDFSTGGYQTADPDDRLWAAAELWETTGDPEVLADFERRAKALNAGIHEDWDWGNVSNLGMFTYALSGRSGKNPEILAKVNKNIVAVASKIVENSRADVFGRPLVRYYWGCNGTVARQVINLQVANRIAPDKKFETTSLAAIGHLFGRNIYNRSYVTGLGINPPMNPHDRRSGSDQAEQPWPGYLVGGGQSATGWNDVQEDYTTNEIAINWQGALVFALGGFISLP
jgi:endoglucanase